MALPGCVYVYQGDELGLEEVEDIEPALRQDPTFVQTGGEDLGRDGCRVPLPWGDEAPDAKSWLPRPAEWAARSVREQSADPDSMLGFYRRALALRSTEPALLEGRFAWLPAQPGVLAFARTAAGSSVRCLVNLSDGPVPLPEHTEVLLSSGHVENGALPRDTAVWLR